MATELTTTTETKDIAVEYRNKAAEYLTAMGLKLPPKHMAQFLELAQEFKLNPFKREIYAVGYGENYNIITGYEVYIQRANSIGVLDGWNATVEGTGEDMTATVTIYRKDWEHPFTHTVYFCEACQKTKEGKPNAVWGKMPRFMLKKVATAQAFRLCFPNQMGGLPYTADELPEPEKNEKNVTPAEEVKVAKKPTKEMAELKKLVEKVTPDGIPLFNENDKAKFREMVKAEGILATIAHVQNEIAAKEAMND